MRKMIATALLLLLFCVEARAELSAGSAFALVRRVSPGTDMREAVAFLGERSSERENGALKIWRWGTDEDEWSLDVLHDFRIVRAARINWTQEDARERLILFSKMTSEGRALFGRAPSYPTPNIAEWHELDGSLLVRAEVPQNRALPVTLLVGVRDDEMETESLGF